MSDRSREQIELLHEELIDIDSQVADGDIDVETAAEIRERYENEIVQLESAAAHHEEDRAEKGSTAARRLNGRALVGVGIVAVALAVIGVFAVRSLESDRVAGADGIVGDVVRGGEQVDLDSISNEEMETVVAQNPGVVPMRLALARRYFDNGDFEKALPHYFEVLNREQNPEALANIGWMTYLSGRPDVAATYVETALDREPDSLVASWFLGNIYVSLGRQDEAAILLVGIIDSDEVPDSVKESAVRLLEEIAGGGS